MSDVRPDHGVFDADNHYYEALDAFTRHLDPAMADRCVKWCTIDGRQYHLLGGKVSKAVTNPTFDPIAKPGVLSEYFRGNPGGANPLELLKDREPIRPAYRDRDARIATLDEQGLEACWMFPTLGMVYEAPLRHDPPAVVETFRAFNRWLAEDWGFSYQDRIIGAPYLTLADPDAAVAELEWALDGGARLLVMLPMAPMTATGRRSPFDPVYDPFWSRLDEAGVTLVLHAGDSAPSAQGFASDDPFAATFTSDWSPSIKLFAIEQAIVDWMLTLVLSNHLVRFPNLRIASVENGAQYLGDLFRKVRSADKKMPGWFPEDPVEIFRRQVWINPFWEDDVHEVVEHMGAERVLFGSDWPHIESLPAPLDYLVEVKDLDPADQRRILRDNAVELTTPRPR